MRLRFTVSTADASGGGFAFNFGKPEMSYRKAHQPEATLAQQVFSRLLQLREGKDPQGTQPPGWHEMLPISMSVPSTEK
jgi:hypothetical protein